MKRLKTMKNIIFKVEKLLKILASSRFRGGILRGVAASVEHIPVLKGKRIDCFIDIGANKGQFSLVAREMFPSAKIIAFEPLRSEASVYEDVLGIDPLVNLNKFAISDIPGEYEMNVSKQADSSSLLEITEAQTVAYPNTAKVSTEMVRTEALDSLKCVENLTGSVFLKIDVQGFELAVLKSGIQTLKYCNWVYVEVSFVELYANQAKAHQVLTFLDGKGLKLVGIYNPSYDSCGRTIQADLLFTTNRPEYDKY